MHVEYVLTISDLPADCIADCSHQGKCDEDVEFWQRKLDFTVDRERAIRCLQGYGAWDKEELAATDDETLAQRVLWLACGDFSEFICHCEDKGIDPRGERPDNFDPPSGSDIFCLE